MSFLHRISQLELSSKFIGHSKIPIATKRRSLEHLGVVRLAMKVVYLRSETFLRSKIFEVEKSQQEKGGYEISNPPKFYRTVILIIDQVVGKQLVSLQSSWQTVGQCLAMMT